MDITKYVHDAEHKRELFSLIGEFCADAVLRTKLGAPISSEPGDIWILGADEEGDVIAFGALRRRKNGRAHLHAVYGHTLSAENIIRKELVSEARHSKAKGVTYTAPEDRAKALASDGWKAGVARGRYITFEKEFEA